MELSLLRLCLLEPDGLIKLIVSLASQNFLLFLSKPNKYLSSSKHFLKESVLFTLMKS